MQIKQLNKWYLSTVLLVLAIQTAPSLHAQTLPTCAFSSSDPDGDGYGWENQRSCIVTDSSTENTSGGPNDCVDLDGDGWGWDGEKICRVAADNCYDSDPIGDGWGWNGVTSCQLSTYPAAFSEVEYLRSKVRPGIEGFSVATIACPWQGDSQLIDLFSDGRMRYKIGDDATLAGFWSSGFVEDDGTIQGTFHRVGSGLRYIKILIQPDSVRLRGSGPSLDAEDCFWLD